MQFHYERAPDVSELLLRTIDYRWCVQNTHGVHAHTEADISHLTSTVENSVNSNN
jgi:hypothetical protein